MAPNSVFIKKDDFCRDSIQDLWRRTFSHCRSLQNMASLFEKLQARSACSQRPQQPLPHHGYKKSELWTGPLSPKALPIPFSNWLLPRQSKCSCKCFVEVFADKPRWEELAPSWKWPNPSLFAEFNDQCQLSRAQPSILPPIISVSSSHLWDLYPTSAPPFLRWFTKGASLQRPF